MLPSPAVISKRSEKSHDAEDAFLGADDDCMRSLPGGRDDSGGRSRSQRGKVGMTAGDGRDDSGRFPCPVGSIALCKMDPLSMEAAMNEVTVSPKFQIVILINGVG